MDVRHIEQVSPFVGLHNAMKIAQWSSREGYVKGAGADGLDRFKRPFVHGMQQPFCLRESTGENHDIALERATVFKRNVSPVHSFDLAVGLDENTDFVKGRCHSSDQAGPAFTDHGQPMFLERRVPIVKLRNTRACQQGGSSSRGGTSVCPLQFSAKFCS